MMCAGSVLPPASLQLLVPPVRLMSAFIWRLVQHNRVLQYDKVLDFITLTTSVVPELLSPCQRARLTMDLRARVRPDLSMFVTCIARVFRNSLAKHENKSKLSVGALIVGCDASLGFPVSSSSSSSCVALMVSPTCKRSRITLTKLTSAVLKLALWSRW